MSSDQKTAISVPRKVYIGIAGSNLDPRFEAVFREGAGKYVVPRFTRQVAEQVVAWTNLIAERDHRAPICTWTDDGYVLLFTAAKEFEPSEVIQPDSDGLYELGFGWAWQAEEVQP